MNPNDFSAFCSAVMIFRTVNVRNLYRSTRNLDIVFILLLTRRRAAESMLFAPSASPTASVPPPGLDDRRAANQTFVGWPIGYPQHRLQVYVRGKVPPFAAGQQNMNRSPIDRQ